MSDHDSCDAAEFPGLGAPLPPPAPPTVRSCNRHNDCDAADERAVANSPKDYYGRPVYTSADHCHDECCEECFGY